MDRRRFLGRLAVGCAALGLGAAPSARQGTPRQEEGTVADVAARWRAQARALPSGWKPSGLSRDHYLRVVQGIVRFFATHQDARGAVLDPYERRERQYSTPAFALAGAALSARGPREEWLPATIRAMEAASADLADGRAADAHSDFYTVLLLHADLVLRSMVSTAVASSWRRHLARIAPDRVYRQQPGSADPLTNWNLVAASGEWLRTREGLGDSRAWVDASLSRQVEHFTAGGMYRDPADPMAYDQFARLWALDLIEEGYTGRPAGALRAAVERGAMASLFMQSPHGEAPCGGRSAHHQWNEAQQAVIFEATASRLARRGDPLSASFKRAARLSLVAIGRWIRPSGELWIVKNRMDPGARHGYEHYSFHSQYNLLTAAMLALAWLRADDQIGEAPVPAEAGGFAFSLQPAFRKAFAAAAGTYVEIDTGADPHYNPTGIVRVHHRGVPSETLSDGVSTACEYSVPRRPHRSLALGPAWRDRTGRWHNLAEHGRNDLEATLVRVGATTPTAVDLELLYRGRLRGGARAVREAIRVTPGSVEIVHVVQGDVASVRVCCPFLTSDGERESAVTVRGPTLEVVRGDGRLQFDVLGHGIALVRAGQPEPCRNGFMDSVHAETTGHTIRSRLTFDRRSTNP